MQQLCFFYNIAYFIKFQNNSFIITAVFVKINFTMKNKQRLFVAINIPEEIKKEVSFLENRCLNLPARWIKKENLHLTLFFAGSVAENNTEKIKNAIKKATQGSGAFSLNAEKMGYAPPKLAIPRMIWLFLGNSKPLSELKKRIEEGIAKTKIENFKFEKKEFLPHITLARIKQWDFRKMEPEEIPEINETLNLKFKVDSVELIESNLKKEGAEYTVLESFPL